MPRRDRTSPAFAPRGGGTYTRRCLGRHCLPGSGAPAADMLQL